MNEGSEKWKIINGFSNYEISNTGKVRIIKSGHIMKTRFIGDYYGLKITGNDKKRKNFHIHRLVALHFVKNDSPEINKIVDHINNNKLDNHAYNLRWVTQSGNMQSHADNYRKYKGKIIVQYNLNKKKIREWSSIKEILEHNDNYTYSRIMRNLKNYHKAYGYYWKYKDDKLIKLEKGEIFKNIGNYEGYDFSNYEVSNYGKVRNIERDKFMKGRISRGYYDVTLYISGIRKSFSIHRLVAHLFVKGQTKTKNVVNHINEDKLDNRASNLEWTCVPGNTKHSVGKPVQQIDPKTNKVINTFDSVTDAYAFFGKRCNSHISRCCKGLESKCLGYKWKYIE